MIKGESNVKERPILFTAPMVRAFLEGRKTQTRRVVKPQPLWVADPSVPFKTQDADPKGIINCPYGQPGDRLWVRETWVLGRASRDDGNRDYHARWTKPRSDLKQPVLYRANELFNDADHKWKPSIYMPRWASRITLEITGVRVERLQDISEADAMAEGCRCDECKRCNGTGIEQSGDHKGSGCEDCSGEGKIKCSSNYRTLFESINGAGSWAKNPWVWVIEFKAVKNAHS